MLYGTVELQNSATPGLSFWNIRITDGTGEFEHFAGQATSIVQATSTSVGVQPYTARLTGILPFLQPRKLPPAQPPEF